MLRVINFFEIPTSTRPRIVELLEGDIAQTNQAADAVVVSAFAGAYFPTPGSLLGALDYHLDVIIDSETIPSHTDYRKRLGTFLYPINTPYIRNLVVLEMRRSNFSLEESLENLFLFFHALEHKGIVFKNIMMPILGAGFQGIPPEKVLQKLIPIASSFLTRSASVEKISFVAYNPEHIEVLNNTINEVIGRPRQLFPASEAIRTIKMQSLKSIEQVQRIIPEPLWQQIQDVLGQEQQEPYRFALLCRKLAEWVVADIVPNSLNNSLSYNISQLLQCNVAPWVVNYLHLLRVFGNEFAHMNINRKSVPANIVENDFLMVMIALENVLQFIKEHHQLSTGT